MVNLVYVLEQRKTLKQCGSQTASFLPELRIYLYSTLTQVSYITTTKTGSYVMYFNFHKYEPRGGFSVHSDTVVYLLSSPWRCPSRFPTLGSPFKSCRGYSVLVMGKDLFATLNLYSDKMSETLYTDEVLLVLGNTSSSSCVLHCHPFALKTQPKYLKQMSSTVMKLFKLISTGGLNHCLFKW